MTDRNTSEGEKRRRIYVPLDRDMSDEEIVQALKDAATKHNAEKKARQEVDGIDEAPSVEGPDE